MRFIISQIRIALFLTLSVYCHINNAKAFNLSDSTSPIEIVSDEVHYLHDEDKAIFSGNVVATQDDLIISSEIMEVLFLHAQDTQTLNPTLTRENKLSLIKLKNNVMIHNNGDMARANEGEYDVQKGVLKLIGNVILEQAGTVLTGYELTHIKASGETLLKSNKAQAKNRVKAHIIPKKMKHDKQK